MPKRIELSEKQFEDLIMNLTPEELEKTKILVDRLAKKFSEDRLKAPLFDFDLSVRAYNVLRTAKAENVGDVRRIGLNELSKIKGAGAKVMKEIQATFFKD